MNPIEKLEDEILDLRAKLAGKCLELAVAQDNSQGAESCQREMYSAINARRYNAIDRAERDGKCFFDVAGEIDRLGV